jgi:hypothetical protein
VNLRAGTRLRSMVCDTEVIVVRVPERPVEVCCGGVAMVPFENKRPASVTARSDLADGTLVGKRYADEERGLEILVTKAGKGTLTADGVRLAIKAAKPLPASD